MNHDPCCPVTTTAEACPICDIIRTVRSQEKDIADGIWRDNLASISKRNYLDGYRDAEHLRPPRYG